METREAIERAHEAHRIAGHGEASEKVGAVVVAVLAAILALSSVFGRRSVAELLLAQEQAVDSANIAESNAVKERINLNALLMLRVWGMDPQNEQAAREAAAELERDIVQTFRPEAERRQEEALALQHERDTAKRRYESFELSETAAQMAIVFATISVVAHSVRLFWVAGALGIVGLLLLVDGFVTILPFPG